MIFATYQRNLNENRQKLSGKAKNVTKLITFRKNVTHSYNADMY